MSLRQSRVPMAILFLAFFAVLGRVGPARAQLGVPEEGRFRTADGLRLYYQWYAGGKGQKSDSVIFVHNYGSDCSKGQWTTLAKSLQEQGYSVLMFDFRGHGKSADFKTMDKPDVFCKESYNRYAGKGLNPKTIKAISKETFQPGYYPYLVNDLTAARRFLDDQNDASQCNSGRVFVIAEQNICPLVMLWMSTEFARYGLGPKTKLENPQEISAGEDLCGAIFLSWSSATIPGAQKALSVADRVMREKELGSDTVLIGNELKKKVAMAFIYGKEDKGSAAEARTWFNRFQIPAGKQEDLETVKYIREIAGAEKLTGSKLLEITEKPKDKDEKVSLLESRIIDFFATIKKKSISGNNWKERKMENLDAIPVPLDLWGLNAPK